MHSPKEKKWFDLVFSFSAFLFSVMDLQTYMQLSSNKKDGHDEDEIFSDVGQMEFRTIKPAGGDTSKVSYIGLKKNVH